MFFFQISENYIRQFLYFTVNMYKCESDISDVYS